MIRKTRLDLYEVEVELVTKGHEFESRWREHADEGVPPKPWNSTGLVQTFHSGDGSHGAPRYVVVIAVDERVIRSESVPYAVRLVTHECVHAGGMILDHVGQEYDGTSEALAYLVSWLADWVWAQLPSSLVGKR